MEKRETVEAYRDRQFVVALERGLRVLQAFSHQAGPLGNGHIVRSTDLPPSTVSRLTHTLSRLGYLSIDQNRLYQLTPKVLTLGYPVLSQVSLLHRARPALAKLAQDTGETAALAGRDGIHCTFMAVSPGQKMLSVRLEVGARLPMATSAAGLAMLKAMTEEERRKVLSRIRAELSRRNHDREAFEQRWQTALQQPVVLLRDIWHKGIGGAAIPVGTANDFGAITLPLATAAVSEDDMREHLSTALINIAKTYQLV